MDTGIIVALITSVAALAGTIITTISSRSSLKSWTAKQQHDLETSKRERAIMTRAQLACLRGLKDDLGCNGPVTQSIEELEAFLIEESHRGRSYHREGA